MTAPVERGIEPLQIGFREFYRIIIPGALSLVLIISVVPQLNNLDWIMKAALSFFLGLVTYSTHVTRRQIMVCGQNLNVFSRQFFKQIGFLIEDLNSVCNLSQGKEYHHRTVWKYFLEKHVDPSLRERIHYFTSFYYMFMDSSVVLLAYLAFNALLQVSSLFSINIIPRQLSVYGTGITISYDLLPYKIVLSIVIFSLFTTGGYKTLREIISEERLLIRREFKSFCQLFDEATWPERQRMETNTKHLSALVAGKTEQILKTIVLDPDVKIEIQGCSETIRIDWKTGSPIRILSVKVKTNNRLMIMGEPGNYKGIYKEHLETLLNDFVSKLDKNYRVHIEVLGDEGPLHKLIPLVRSLQDGIITNQSPVYAVARKYNMPYILVRGRYIEGPNPGLTEISENLLAKYGFRKVLDLFAGTGIVARVALANKAEKVVCVDRTTANELISTFKSWEKVVEVAQDDVFAFKVKEPFDLIVADPDFEDALRVAREVVPRIRNMCKVFVLCHGSVEDERWNKEIRAILQTSSNKTEQIECAGQAFTICFF